MPPAGIGSAARWVSLQNPPRSHAGGHIVGAMSKLTDFARQSASALGRGVTKYAERGSAELHYARKMFEAGALKMDPLTFANLLADMAQASGEQTKGVAQVGVAIHELDQGTQGNAAMVEETAASAAALKEQAERLREQVDRFNLG